eukprot:3892395-Amphidinium_carterae.2
MRTFAHTRFDASSQSVTSSPSPGSLAVGVVEPDSTSKRAPRDCGAALLLPESLKNQSNWTSSKGRAPYQSCGMIDDRNSPMKGGKQRYQESATTLAYRKFKALCLML